MEFHSLRAVCGAWCVVVYHIWCMVCGVSQFTCSVWCVGCGVWCVACGVWCVVCGVWCVVCGDKGHLVYGVWNYAVCVVCVWHSVGVGV